VCVVDMLFVQWICCVCSGFVSVGKFLCLPYKKRSVKVRALGKRR